ncbi:hypothetical protein Tco_1410726 [Tanacetum coccineum]
MNKRQMQTQESKINTGKALDADLVDTKSIRKDSTLQMTTAGRVGPVSDNTTEQATSLLANNAELKAHIQEKVFAIAALKNDLRKLKEFSEILSLFKTSVLGKPVITSLETNQLLNKECVNSSKNMPRFSSNDMVHNHYLDVAKKKIQERDRNSTTSVTTSARFQSTADDSKPKPRSNNQTSRSLPVSKSSRVTITAVAKADHSKSYSSFSDSKQKKKFVCSTCHKYVFNANHDACVI